MYTVTALLCFYQCCMQAVAQKNQNFVWFDSRTGNASLCPWQRLFTLISST